MAVSLLTRFLATYDPIHRGWTPRGIALGLAVTGGFGTAKVRGGHALYMGVGEPGTRPSPDWSHAVGAVGPSCESPGTIRTWPGVVLPAEKALAFGVRAFSPGGAEEAGTRQVVRLETDAEGEPTPLVPNAPVQLVAVPRAGGSVLLTWRYDPRGEGAPVSRFRVYHDDGTGEMVAEALAEQRGRAYLAGPYADGLTVTFRVRAVSAAGDEETNTQDVSAVAIASGPADLGAPTVAAGPEE